MKPDPFLQEPLPTLRDAGEPLVEMSTAAKRLQMSADSVRALAENGKLLGFERNAQAGKGAEKRTRWVFTDRMIRLYEAITANHSGFDVAVLLLDVAKRLSPKLRLWLRNEINRSLESGQ